MTVRYVAERTLPSIVLVRRREVNAPFLVVLWQAEAESSTLLSRTVQDKGPLPLVWG